MTRGGVGIVMHEHGGGWAGATSVQSADDDDPRNFVTMGPECLERMAGAPFARAAFSSPPSRTTSADAVQTKASNLSAGAINLSASIWPSLALHVLGLLLTTTRRPAKNGLLCTNSFRQSFFFLGQRGYECRFALVYRLSNTGNCAPKPVLFLRPLSPP